MRTNAAVVAVAAPATAPRKPRPASPSLLHQPAVIVLGHDDRSKPHASWFDEAEARAATKASGLMGMRALPVADDAIRQLAARLPHGRVFASGRAFVPFVKASLFDELAAHLPDGDAPPPVRLVGSRPAPKKTDAAKGAPAEGGDDEDAGSTGEGDDHDGDAGGGGEAGWLRPEDWSSIAVGSVVLATEGGSDGWYESVIEEARDGDLFILHWRDWPELPRFLRPRSQLGLLPPGRA